MSKEIKLVDKKIVEDLKGKTFPKEHKYKRKKFAR